MDVSTVLFLVFCLLATSAQACVFDNVTRKHGEEWVKDERFLFKCEVHKHGWSVKPVGCQQNGTRYPLDETNKCKIMTDGRVRFVDGPVCEGKQEGETWTSEHFRRKCVDGVVKFIGCVTDDGVFVEAGEEVKSANVTWKCEAQNNGIKLYPKFVKKGIVADVKAADEQKAAKAQKFFDASQPSKSVQQPESTHEGSGEESNEL